MQYVKSMRQMWMVEIIRKLWPNVCFLTYFNLEDFFNSVNFNGLKLWAWRTKIVFPDKEKIQMYWFEIDKQNYSKISRKVKGPKKLLEIQKSSSWSESTRLKIINSAKKYIYLYFVCKYLYFSRHNYNLLGCY